MSFNYRVVKIVNNDEPNEVMYAIHEIYYDNDGNITNWSDEPLPAISDEPDFKWLIEKIIEATTKPILIIKQSIREINEGN